MRAFYNEIDRYCCDWLSNLMDAGLIAGGKIDDRSIEEITADDVAGYSRVHFFAGIGGWDLALQLAGWPEDRPVWTGSCPCQPFSAAGKQQGESDKRHLWPQFHRLIAAAKPAVAFGEQVASKLGRGWLAGVRADLEIMGYDVGAADLCAAGVGEKAEARIDFEDHTFRWDTVVVGAPHIRQRLWFVADTGLQRGGKSGELAGASSALPGEGHQREWVRDAAEHRGSNGSVADADGGDTSAEREQRSREQRRFAQDGRTGELANADKGGREFVGAARIHEDGASGDDAARRRAAGGMGDAKRDTGISRRVAEQSREGDGAPRAGSHAELGRSGDAELECAARDGREQRWPESSERSAERGRGIGFWSAFDVIPCRDGKARRVEPGSFPLAHGIPARVAKLRAFGNAIVPEVAAEFIAAYMHVRGIT